MRAAPQYDNVADHDGSEEVTGVKESLRLGSRTGVSRLVSGGGAMKAQREATTELESPFKGVEQVRREHCLQKLGRG